MRPNVRLHTPDELHQHWLQRDLYLKQFEASEDDDAPYALMYAVLCGVVWSFVGLLWWLT